MIQFAIEDTRDYQHYSYAVCSIIKMKSITGIANYNDDDILRSIVTSDYYLWNYKLFPEGHPFGEERSEMHGPFKREKIAPSDYTLLSYRQLAGDITNFIIQEICFTNTSHKKADQTFLNQIINEVVTLYDPGLKCYKLNLELNDKTDIDSDYYKDKISDWHPFSIFKSYIVFDTTGQTFYIIQIGDD